jgi:hypothetical protein
MNNDKTPVNEPTIASAAESGDDPEVEGHYMHQLAVEQEAKLRQARIMEARDRSHHQMSDDTASNGIIDRFRRRINR